MNKKPFKVGDLVGMGGMTGIITSLSDNGLLATVVFTPMLEPTLVYCEGMVHVDDADAYLNQIGYREQLYEDQIG